MFYQRVTRRMMTLSTGRKDASLHRPSRAGTILVRSLHACLFFFSLFPLLVAFSVSDLSNRWSAVYVNVLYFGFRVQQSVECKIASRHQEVAEVRRSFGERGLH